MRDDVDINIAELCQFLSKGDYDKRNDLPKLLSLYFDVAGRFDYALGIKCNIGKAYHKLGVEHGKQVEFNKIVHLLLDHGIPVNNNEVMGFSPLISVLHLMEQSTMLPRGDPYGDIIEEKYDLLSMLLLYGADPYFEIKGESFVYMFFEDIKENQPYYYGKALKTLIQKYKVDEKYYLFINKQHYKDTVDKFEEWRKIALEDKASVTKYPTYCLLSRDQRIKLLLQDGHKIEDIDDLLTSGDMIISDIIEHYKKITDSDPYKPELIKYCPIVIFKEEYKGISDNAVGLIGEEIECNLKLLISSSVIRNNKQRIYIEPAILNQYNINLKIDSWIKKDSCWTQEKYYVAIIGLEGSIHNHAMYLSVEKSESQLKIKIMDPLSESTPLFQEQKKVIMEKLLSYEGTVSQICSGRQDDKYATCADMCLIMIQEYLEGKAGQSITNNASEQTLCRIVTNNQSANSADLSNSLNPSNFRYSDNGDYGKLKSDSSDMLMEASLLDVGINNAAAASQVLSAVPTYSVNSSALVLPINKGDAGYSAHYDMQTVNSSSLSSPFSSP